MLYELWTSQRYIKSRQRERFISLTAFISTIGIALGVMVLIVVIAVMSGFDKFLEDKMIGANAHLIVTIPGGTENSAAIADEISKIDSVLAVSPFIVGQTVIKQEGGIVGVDFRGIDPVTQPKVTKFQEYIVDGSMDVSGNEVLIGKELAYRLGVWVDDALDLISPTTMKPVKFTVRGVFNSGMYLYDSNLVMTSLDGAERFFKKENLKDFHVSKIFDF